MLHMFCETLEVTPIGAIVLLFEMSLKPTMGISLESVSLVHLISTGLKRLPAGLGGMLKSIGRSYSLHEVQLAPLQR